MDQEQKKDINQKYNKATGAFFYASLIQIPIFALPAIISVFLGKYLDNKFDTGKMWTLILLAISFVVSWISVFKTNAKITKEYKRVREEMKKEQQD